MNVPRSLQSIRFRLSLAFSTVVFSVGSFLIAGIYLYQVNQLSEPVLQSQPIILTDPSTGLPYESSIKLVFPEEVQRYVVEELEQSAYRRALHELRSATLGSMVVLFLASFGTGWLFAGWTLKPMERISGVARHITATDLNRRISMRGPDDELKALADTFDAMLDRLQESFEDQRRFAHEASHELRNPLAVARTNLELALTGGDEDEVRQAATIAFGATERMSALIEDLLEQARQGVPELHHGPANLSQIVEELATEFGAPAEQRRLKIVVDAASTRIASTSAAPPSDASAGVVLPQGAFVDSASHDSAFCEDASPDRGSTDGSGGAAAASGSVIVQGDAPALRRAVANLLSNAVRLAPERSTITIGVEASATEARISVADEGPGIAAEERHLVFDRFWRGSDPGSGSGLGLSIVRRIAERHGGSVSLWPNPVGGDEPPVEPKPVSIDVGSAVVPTGPAVLNQFGSTFTLHLPMQTRLQPSQRLREKTSLATQEPESRAID